LKAYVSELLLVTVAASFGAFTHFGVAAFTGLVCEVLAESLDLAASFCSMAFGAVTA
jgi:hypothetical protein